MEIKWYVPFRSERSEKSAQSFEAIHFFCVFRFSRLVLMFQEFFYVRQEKMADNEGNEGEFENCLKSIFKVNITKNYYESPL